MNKYLEFSLEKLGWKDTGNPKRDFLRCVFYLARAYMVVVALTIVFQRSFLYHPTSQWAAQPEAFGGKAVTYTTQDGITHTSWYCAPQGKKPVFAMFHGNAGNVSQRAYKMQFFCKRGYGFLVSEYRGYGMSAGLPRENGLYSDGRAAMNWLLDDRKVDESRIVLYGESIGTGIASQMALEYKKARALVLETPLTNIPDMLGTYMPWMIPFQFLVADVYDNVAKAPHFKMPVIIFHGDSDRIIPVEKGKAVFAALGNIRKELLIFKGGRHNDLANFGSLFAVLKFVEKSKVAE